MNADNQLGAMRLLAALLAALALTACSPSPVPDASTGGAAQTEVEDNPSALYQQSRQARREGDLAGALVYLQRAAGAVEDKAIFSYELAKAHARLGQSEEALPWLEVAIETGAAWQADREPEFADMLSEPGFQALLPQIEASRQATGTSSVVAVVPQRDLLPEGIAWDPVKQQIFLSSTHRRKIIAIRLDGTSEDFVEEAAAGIWGTVGLRADADRRLLWVNHGNVGAGMPMAVPEPETFGATGLIAFDLDDRSVRRRHIFGGPEERRFFNDQDVRRSDGDVFLSDSLAGIFRLDFEEDRLYPVYTGPELRFPNGVVLSADERQLFVAHIEGLAVVDVADGSFRTLTPPSGTMISGTDGLERHGDSLLAVQPSMQRVLRLRFDPATAELQQASVLLSHHPDMARPTTGVVADDILYLIANAQLQSHNGDGTLWTENRLFEPVILSAPLTP